MIWKHIMLLHYIKEYEIFYRVQNRAMNKSWISSAELLARWIFFSWMFNKSQTFRWRFMRNQVKRSNSDTCELYRRLKRSKNRFASFLKRKWRSVFQRVLLQLLPVAFVYSNFLFYLILRIFNFQNYSYINLI